MSMDSGQRPLTHVRYQSANASPYGAGDPYYNNSTGYLPAQKAKKGLSPWIKFGVPVAIIVIVAVVVGAVVGTKKHNDNKSAAAASDPSAAASSAISAKSSIGRFAVSTDSEFMMPVYPSTVSLTARLSHPGCLAINQLTDEHGIVHYTHFHFY